MAGDFGDADGVRRLGQALLAAGRGVAGVTGDLSGQVKSLVPAGWSGGSAEGFGSDWNHKSGQADQLAAVCAHVGQVLVDLAGELDSAGQRAANARQLAGGLSSIRFGEPGAQQRSAQVLSQAAGAAGQARAAARARLAGIAVPRIGQPLTASQVDAWASKAAPGRVPLFQRLTGDVLGDIRDFARRTGLATAWGTAENTRVTGLETVGQEAHFAEGFADGLVGFFRGLGDLAPGPDGGLGRWLWGDSSALQQWHRLGDVAAPFTGAPDTASPAADEEFGKSLLAWDEWRTDPARAAGNVFFNLASSVAGTKFLPLGKTAGATRIAERTAVREDPGKPPGPPPASFGHGTQPEASADRLDLPSDTADQLEYRKPVTRSGEPVPVFDGTPLPGEAIQLGLGDCGLVGTLRAVARLSPDKLASAIREAPDGRVMVRLHKVRLAGMEAVPTGETADIPVSREVPAWKDTGETLGTPSQKTSWAAMLEKALAASDKRWTAGRIKLNDDLWREQAIKIRGLKNDEEIKALLDARGYARLDRGLTYPEMAEVMAEVTGERASVLQLSSQHVESALSRLVRERKPIIVTSRSAKVGGGPSAYGVRGGHAYEVTGVEDGKVIMKNPWGNLHPDPVPAQEFLKEFNNLIVTRG